MKIVMVTSLLPYTNYSHFLCSSLALGKDEIIVYCDKDKKNLEIKDAGKIIPVWDKNLKFFFQIFTRLLKDKPDLVHFQHEINKFGGMLTTVAFPFLCLTSKLFGFKIVATIHAVVSKSLINQDFVEKFTQNKLILPLFLKIFFAFLYKSIEFSCDLIIVHSTYLKDILVSEYQINPHKVEVVPHGVPLFENLKIDKRLYPEKYFLYFGYLVKRKGLDFVLEGFSHLIKNPKYKNIRLVLAGGVIPGQEYAKDGILERIHELSLDDYVIMPGFIDDGALFNAFYYSEAVLVPAELSIAASGPLALGLGFGRCILGSDVGNLAYELKKGSFGIVTPNNKWGDLFEKVLENPTIVSTEEKRSKKVAQERSWGNMAKKHLSFYEKILLRH